MLGCIRRIPWCTRLLLSSGWHCKSPSKIASVMSTSALIGIDSFPLPSDVKASLSNLYGADLQPRLHLVTTGAGGKAVSWLMGMPGLKLTSTRTKKISGASGTLLEAIVPYSRVLGREWAGDDTHAMCCTETSISMSRKSLSRAATIVCKSEGLSGLLRNRGHLFGIGCTAAIATSRDRAGEDRAFVCCSGNRWMDSYSLKLPMGAYSRTEEDDLVSRLIIRALSDAAGLTCSTDFAPLSTLDYRKQVGYISDLLTRPDSICAVMWVDDTAFPDVNLPERSVVLSGSFNPLHEGHINLLQAVVAAETKQHNGCPPPVVAFEMSVHNADKGILEESEVHRRLEQFRGVSIQSGDDATTRIPTCVILTRLPLFIEKAKQFPGCTFAMGSDTAERLLDPRYYGDAGSILDMSVALSTLQHNRCSICIGGRLEGGRSGRDFMTGDHVLASSQIPPEMRKKNIFHTLSEADFRLDVSSTELREKRKKSGGG
eukprot:122195_1